MPYTQFRFDAIGTAWAIEIFEPLTTAQHSELERAIMARIEQYDKDYSRFRDDSLVTQMSNKAEKYTLPDDAGPLFDMYRALYEATGGAVTPLIGQTLSDAGYDARYTLQPGELTAPPRWDDVMTYSYPTLDLHQPALLDVGAAGKGYLADLIGELLQSHDVTSYCINAGGDFVCMVPPDKPVDIALEHPDDTDMVIGVAHLLSGSLCGSAGNRRTWAGGTYHHIIDPKLLQSPRHLKAVWVVAESGLVADGLTTALYFVEPAQLAEEFEFEYAILDASMHMHSSAAFPATIFTDQLHQEQP